MKDIAELLAGYGRFRNGRYGEQKDLYARLAHGQEPGIMLIGCADSRADPSDIFDSLPGELFTVRNVANLVPPSEDGRGLHGTSAAIEFAVTALKVRHIVVMGHASCGGVGACLAAKTDRPVGTFIAPWVSLLDGARDHVLAQNPEDPQRALEWQGIRQSLANLRTFSFVEEAVSQGALELHGAWFAIDSGQLLWLNSDSDAFAAVEA